MLPEHLRDKRIGILGFGRNHQALLGWLLRHGAIDVIVYDEALDTAERVRSAGFDVRVIAGHGAFEQLAADVLFRSPGIPNHRPELVNARENGVRITSQTELFLELCPARTVGVTGTKGKSTTSALTAHLIGASGIRAYLAGNIGKDPFDFLDELTSEDVVVLELSSFQLDGIAQSPHVAVVVGVTVDHLDHHRSVGEYRDAKANIVSYQRASDFSVLNLDDPVSASFSSHTEAARLYFSVSQPVVHGCYRDASGIFYWVDGNGQAIKVATLGDVRLVGVHHHRNVAAAITATLALDISPATIQSALRTFGALPHRFELICERDGVAYYDDSYATMPDAAVAALRSIDRPFFLIVGGSDKGAIWDELGRVIAESSPKLLLTIGITGPAIAKAAAAANFPEDRIIAAGTLDVAMAKISMVVRSGDAVLLSPASASLDQFKNAAERGDRFAALAKAAT